MYHRIKLKRRLALGCWAMSSKWSWFVLIRVHLYMQLFRPEAPPSEGPQYVNKAFSAYRGIYIEKEDLQMELNKLVRALKELHYLSLLWLSLINATAPNTSPTRKRLAEPNKPKGPKENMLPVKGLPPLPLLFLLLTSLAPPSLPQKKEKSESERLLTEQLQAKEWELLQLKTEMETSQGTGSANRISFLLHVVITQNVVCHIAVRACLCTERLQLECVCLCAHFYIN